MSETHLQEGRIEQKRRTRGTILKAALRLIQRGERLTMTSVAEEAQVGRATLYRYFPNLEALLVEAPLDQHTLGPNRLLQGIAESDVEARAAKVQRYLYDFAVQHEAEFRMYLRGTMDEWLLRRDRDEGPPRLGRRLEMLDAALASHRGVLPPGDFARLRDALATMVGIESLIVMRDVCGRSIEEGREIMEWAVRTLVSAALDASGNDSAVPCTTEGPRPRGGLDHRLQPPKDRRLFSGKVKERPAPAGPAPGEPPRSSASAPAPPAEPSSSRSE